MVKSKLADHELLAMIMGPGKIDPLRLEKAKSLLRRHGLAGLTKLSHREWKSEPIGRVSASRLGAVFEIARRAYGNDNDRPVISKPRAAFKEVRNIANLKKEHLVGLYLDAQNGLLHKETISMGSLNTTRTHPREILQPAVVHLAMGFILAHNHPSGNLDPSIEDVEFTRAVSRAGELMGIELYDHVIVAAGGFVSMRERGLL